MLHISSCALTGFKRFNAETRFPLASRVTALVGPNRSGKTSLLQALAIHQQERQARGTGRFLQGPSDGVYAAAAQIASRLETIVLGRNDRSNMCFTVDDDVTYVPRDMGFPQTTDEVIRKPKVLETEELTAIGHLTAHYAAGLKAANKLAELGDLIIKVFPGIGTDEVVSTVSRTLGLRITWSVVRRNCMSRGTQVTLSITPGRWTTAARSRGSTGIGHVTAPYAAELKAANKLAELGDLINKVFPGIGTVEVGSTGKVHRLRSNRSDVLTPWWREGSGVCFVLTIFAALLSSKSFRASPPDSIFTTWGDAKPDALKAVLKDKRSKALASLDSPWAANVAKGRSKFVKEFGTSVAVAKSSPGAKSAFQAKDLGKIFDGMDKRFLSDPTRGMDAKGPAEEPEP
ncbi:hypothetical protein HKX48_001522 [Thoreauomyces humboldtii]|nr:hypothetical protein HKX48_001522 [Thoreauomyces humboldtii]